MKKKSLILLCFMLVLALSSCQKKYDVYLMIGQSNMAGRGELLPADSLESFEGVFLLDDEGELVPASHPFNAYSSIRKAMHVQGMGPAASFAEAVARNSRRPVLLVVNARGGTSIKSWLKDAPAGKFSNSRNEDPLRRGQDMPSFYDDALRRTKQALQYGELKAILWHQGESDSDSLKAAVYMDKLSTLVSDLREDLGVGEEVPFVAGEILRTHTNARHFNPVISSISDYIPNSACVSSEGLRPMPDNLHFDRESQRELGLRYAELIGIQAR